MNPADPPSELQKLEVQHELETKKQDAEHAFEARKEYARQSLEYTLQ
jgi:hypothetical protein